MRVLFRGEEIKKVEIGVGGKDLKGFELYLPVIFLPVWIEHVQLLDRKFIQWDRNFGIIVVHLKSKIFILSLLLGGTVAVKQQGSMDFLGQACITPKTCCKSIWLHENTFTNFF